MNINRISRPKIIAPHNLAFCARPTRLGFSANLQPSTANLLPRLYRGDLVDGRYRVDGTVAQGGMAGVIKAKDELSNETVALKIAGDGYGELLAQEAEVLKDITEHTPSPGIIKYVGSGTVQGYAYLALEFVQGEDLLRELHNRGIIPFPWALRIAAQVGAALKDAAVMHKDLKHENILIRENGDAVLIDFGISKYVGTEGNLAGTPLYMAPEQMRNVPELDPRADIYSLGVVLYEIMTGRQLFNPLPSEPEKILVEKMNSLNPEIENASPALQTLVDKMLAADRENRWQNWDEVLTAIQAAQEEVEMLEGVFADLQASFAGYRILKIT